MPDVTASYGMLSNLNVLFSKNFEKTYSIQLKFIEIELLCYE